jgi:hypothetical protein
LEYRHFNELALIVAKLLTIYCSVDYDNQVINGGAILKKYFGILVCFALVTMGLVFVQPTEAVSAGVWLVDVGDTVSEASVIMLGWGQVEGLANRGGYGGIDDCKCVWENTAPGAQGEPEACASITYVYTECVKSTQLDINALDGEATDDGYTVKVDGLLVDTYINQDTQGQEIWFLNSIDLTQFPLQNSQTHIVEICATGVAWTGFHTWGQVAIDYVNLTTVPCEGDGEGDISLEGQVVTGNCICLGVSPYSLNFGSVSQGSVSNTFDITLRNCGDVPITVVANVNGDFYEDCLELSTSPWGSAEGWASPIIAVGGSLIVHARVNVSAGYGTGTYSGSLSFVASFAPY